MIVKSVKYKEIKMNKFISFEFSKLLWDNGCRLESDEYICTTKQIEFKEKNKLNEFFNGYPSYDILWDICVKYRNEFFGEELEIIEGFEVPKHYIVSNVITSWIKDNKEQNKIEKYIWDNCLFNPKNKGE
jgi:hypothetical protein